MIIKKLTMHNFGVYAGTNILDFKGEKPIVLIGGMNGRGKTTILEAVLLSLYGSNSFAYKASKYNSYSHYLKSYINKTDGTFKTFIEIVFSMNTQEEYSVKREWDGANSEINENIIVKKNGEDNSFLSENWTMFVENILPSALSSFFFFDGEKIAELASEDTSKQMKESIKAMLGISILDVLQSDIKKIISKKVKENAEDADLKDLEKFRLEKENAEQKLKEQDEKIETLQQSNSKLQSELEQLKLDYTIQGGKIAETKESLMQQKNQYIAELESIQEQLIELSSSDLPLLLVKDLLEKILQEARQEHDNKVNYLILEKIPQLQKAYIKKYPRKSKSLDSFIDFIKEELEQNKGKVFYNLSDSCFEQLESLFSSNILQQSKEKAKNLIQEREQKQKKINDIDNELSVNIEESTLTNLSKKIKEKESDIAKNNTEIERLNKERSSIHGNLILAESEFAKYIETKLTAMESEDIHKRTIKYSKMAIEIIKLFRIRLQERKINNLSKTMTECYQKLSNKKNLINDIIIDADTLNIHYKNAQGDEIDKKRLSAGERQIMVVSLLWSLAICSKKKLPVIIDTPLSRLDSSRRNAFIKIYFPNASEQTIILSTDSEIDQTYYKSIRKNIGDEYTLKFNDTTNTSKIVSGYFGWNKKYQNISDDGEN